MTLACLRINDKDRSGMRLFTQMLVQDSLQKDLHMGLRFSYRLHLKKGVTRVQEATSRHAYYKGNSYVEAIHPHICY